MEIFTNTKIDFIGKKNAVLMVLLLLLLIGLGSIIFKGGFNYGIDFLGGTIIQVKFNNAVTADEVRNAVGSDEIGNFAIQHYGPRSNHEMLIRLSPRTRVIWVKTPAWSATLIRI